MEWTDSGIVLGSRPQGETSLILSVLTRDHGRAKGLVRGGARSRQRGLYEPGNHVAVIWRARLAEHLGHWSLESLAALTAQFLDDSVRLACLSAAVALAESCLPEHQPYPGLHDGLMRLTQALADDDGWAPAHLGFECQLLADLGYGLDLASCAVMGTTEELAFVSPRTGRAVSRAAAGEYQDRLLVLPRLLGGTGRADSDARGDLMDGLRLTGHFLDRNLFQPHAQTLPAARSRYVERLERLLASDQG
ncbi:MAG TPA: DNA repair protein RecO [Stellaceae bacterium]|nr:DNA repair protein RecO [Stellaceae bacterium]